MKTRTTAATAAVAALAAASGAHGAFIHHTDLTEGLASVSLIRDAITVDAEADPTAFKAKTVNEVTGVGVAGGVVDGEIDYTESITFRFSQPVIVTTLTLTHLFTARSMGDAIDEVALITTDSGSYTLEATGETTATWTGLGDAVNMSTADDTGSGEWMALTDLRSDTGIFGQPVSTLTLSSGRPGTTAAVADFAFVEMAFHPVPVPTPATLPILAALGAGLARRKRHQTS